MTNVTDLKITPAGEGEIEIEASLDVAKFESYREKTIKTLANDLRLDGFRPGHIPTEVAVKEIGEEKILWEMAQEAIADTYPAILEENKIMALGRPAVTITKIAVGNPLGFKIKTAIMPEIKLGDYQALAKKINSEPAEALEVNDEEVAKVLEDLQKSRASAEHAHSDTPKHGEGDHEHKDCDCPPSSKKDSGVVKPELNDEFAKSLGKFETLEELKTKIKENLELEKKGKAKDKKRVAIVSEVIKKSEIKIAQILIENEKDKMLAEMESQIGYMGLKFDDYLSHLKKTREELRDSWNDQARERVAFGLVLGEIAHQEKIVPPEDELKNEVDYLKNQYKDVEESRLRAYASSLIVNEKVFEFLENLK